MLFFFAGESVPVNRKLSEILLQLHISEKTGRGVPKITERYGRTAFEFRENSIVVTIPFRWINKMNDKEMNTLLTQTQLRILTELRNNSNITKSKLMDKVNVGKITIDKGIAVLKKMVLSNEWVPISPVIGEY